MLDHFRAERHSSRSVTVISPCPDNEVGFFNARPPVEIGCWQIFQAAKRGAGSRIASFAPRERTRSEAAAITLLDQLVLGNPPSSKWLVSASGTAPDWLARRAPASLRKLDIATSQARAKTRAKPPSCPARPCPTILDCVRSVASWVAPAAADGWMSGWTSVSADSESILTAPGRLALGSLLFSFSPLGQQHP